MSLGSIVHSIAVLRADMRERAASPAEIEAATERVVRANWPVKDEREWPVWMTLARCAYCDGTGLVIHRGVRNRLGVVVDEGTPCRCALGVKFSPKPQTSEDFESASKTKRSKPMKRFGQ